MIKNTVFINDNKCIFNNKNCIFDDKNGILKGISLSKILNGCP